VNHVTYEQFTRALTKLGLNLPAICFKVLARKYMDKNNTREINYDQFLKDVDYEHLLKPNGLHAAADLQAVQQSNAALKTGNPPFGVDLLPGERDAQAGAAKKVQFSLDENDKKKQFDEDGIVFDRAEQKEFHPAGLDKTENRKGFTGTAIGNSTLKVDSTHETARDIDSLEEKIKAHVVMYKIRIDQFFLDFDKLRKGTVTKDQFRRVLALSGVTVEDYQYDLLVNKYGLDNSSNMDWFSFCKTIDRVFTTRGIEKDPLFEVPQIVSDTTIPARRHFLKLNEDHRDKLMHILNLVNKEIQTRRVLIKPHFQDFDRTRNGYVTRSQFLRVLSTFDIYPKDEYLDILLRCYTDNGNLNEVNYFEFCKDVDGQDSITQSINNKHASQFTIPPVPHTVQPYIYKDSNASLQEVVARIQRKVKEERIRVQEFLRDFDGLRSGAITNSQFRIGLNMAKIPLSNSDFNTLVEYFKVQDKPGMFRWNEFCDVVDQVFNIKHLEMHPERDAQLNQTLTKSVRSSMGPIELDLAKKVVDRFKFFTQATRLYIKQFFQDWDRLGRNKVTPKQFRQVLATVKFNMTDPEHRAITNYYLCDDGYVNYVEFIKDTTPDIMHAQAASTLSKSGLSALGPSPAAPSFQTDSVSPQQALPEAPRPTGQPPHYSYMPDLDVDPMKTLERIKRDIRVSRTRLKEYLQDFDGLRKGTMTANKFFGSLDKMKYASLTQTPDLSERSQSPRAPLQRPDRPLQNRVHPLRQRRRPGLHDARPREKPALPSLPLQNPDFPRPQRQTQPAGDGSTARDPPRDRQLREDQSHPHQALLQRQRQSAQRQDLLPSLQSHHGHLQRAHHRRSLPPHLQALQPRRRRVRLR